jgi:hypothetical protein
MGKVSRRHPDGTLFVDEPISIQFPEWYACTGTGQGLTVSGKSMPSGGVTHPQELSICSRADLRLTGAYKGYSKTPYKAKGPETGGWLAVVAVGEDSPSRRECPQIVDSVGPGPALALESV